VAPVQGMQGEVEIIYQILGSDRSYRQILVTEGIRRQRFELAI